MTNDAAPSTAPDTRLASTYEHELDPVEVADALVARRTRRFTAPVRRLVNAPHLLVAAILVIWVGCSLTYAALEDKGPIEGLWWGIVTGSTVGYGDFYPASTAGRATGAILIVAMLILIPIAIGHVIANLVLDRNQFTHDEQVALALAVDRTADRVDTIEQLLIAHLTAARGADWVRERLDEIEAADAANIDHSEHMVAVMTRAED